MIHFKVLSERQMNVHMRLMIHFNVLSERQMNVDIHMLCRGKGIYGVSNMESGTESQHYHLK